MMKEARLEQEICLSDFGGAELFIADINNDSQPEFLWLQSAGMLQSTLYSGRGWITEEEQKIFCLTATDTKGNIIWQIGAPHNSDIPYCSHGGQRMAAVADIDGDNIPEVLYVEGRELTAVNGPDGSTKYRTSLPFDNLAVLCLAKIDKTPAGWAVVAKASDSGHAPYVYGNPVVFYNGRLEPLWPMQTYMGAGHAPLAVDMDGDGLEELLIGYNLIDTDGRLKWTLDFWEGKDIDPEEDHSDWIEVDDVNDDGRLEIAYAGSSHFLLSDSEGHLIFSKQMTHPQGCQIGKFQAGIKGKQIIVFNKRGETFLLDCEGNVVWSRTLEDNWPLGKPAVCEGRKFHLSQPGIVLTRGLFAEENALLYAEGGWPYVVDGNGEKCLSFPPNENTIQPEAKVRNHRPDDYGFGYHCEVSDLDGTGREKVIIHDRRYAWIYGF